MRKDSKIELRTILFEAFANPDFYNAQDPSIFWAIDEGHNRHPTFRYFNTPTARKEHQCIRGCHIHVGDIYFRESAPSSTMKICAGCMAMILYYLEVWNLPAVQYDYWDNELNCPHFDPNGTLSQIWHNIPALKIIS